MKVFNIVHSFGAVSCITAFMALGHQTAKASFKEYNCPALSLEASLYTLISKDFKCVVTGPSFHLMAYMIHTYTPELCSDRKRASGLFHCQLNETYHLCANRTIEHFDVRLLPSLGDARRVLDFLCRSPASIDWNCAQSHLKETQSCIETELTMMRQWLAQLIQHHDALDECRFITVGPLCMWEVFEKYCGKPTAGLLTSAYIDFLDPPVCRDFSISLHDSVCNFIVFTFTTIYLVLKYF